MNEENQEEMTRSAQEAEFPVSEQGVPLDKKEDEEPSIRKGVHRAVTFVFSLGGLVIVFIFILGIFADDFEKYLQEKDAEKLLQETEKVTEEIKNAYENDFDGGVTPEATFDLFLTALKANDPVQAATYYELSVQGDALEGLEDELAENGDLMLSRVYFSDVRERGVKECNKRGDGCVFKYVYVTTETSTSTAAISQEIITIVTPAGSESKKILSLHLNEYTNVWKITQPF